MSGEYSARDTEGYLRQRVADFYSSGEVLPEQTGVNNVLTFLFVAIMDTVWVVGTSGTTVFARVNPFGGVPTATAGIPLPRDVPREFPLRTQTIRVWAPTSRVISVWGFKR